MTLAKAARTGGVFRVTAIASAPGAALRLRELGLGPGAEIEILHSAGSGTRLVAVGHSRFALDRDTMNSLVVEPVL